MNKPFRCSLLLAALLLLHPLASHAERSDRSQPINIDADRVNVDERQSIHTFEGNVLLTQGSLQLRGHRMVVTQDANGFQTGVVTAQAGRLATFQQKRQGSNEIIEGEAERIEYHARSETAKLIRRARVKSGGDVVTGDVIEYDAVTENYTASRLPANGGSDSRIRVTIQPKN